MWGAGSSLARFRLRVQKRKKENFYVGLPFFLFLTPLCTEMSIKVYATEIGLIVLLNALDIFFNSNKFRLVLV